MDIPIDILWIYLWICQAGLRELQRDIDESKALSVDQFAAGQRSAEPELLFGETMGDLTRENCDFMGFK